MQEFLRYINIIKQVLDRDYGKERVFYNDGEWYDRNSCKNLSLDELEKEVVEVVSQPEKDKEYIIELTDKIYELMGEEDAEQFFGSIER